MILKLPLKIHNSSLIYYFINPITVTLQYLVIYIELLEAQIQQAATS